jgi:hypothetical protein
MSAKASAWLERIGLWCDTTAQGRACVPALQVCLRQQKFRKAFNFSSKSEEGACLSIIDTEAAVAEQSDASC